MSDHTLSALVPPHRPAEPGDLRRDLLGSTAQKVLVAVSGGKGGCGKTANLAMVTDLCAAAGPTLVIDTDDANKHAFNAFMRETSPGSGLHEPRQAGIRAVQMRLRAEDVAGRIDPTHVQDLLEVVEGAPEAFVTVDLPAGDTATMRRCTEIIVGTCRGLGIRLVVVVSAVAVDPTGREVLEALVPLLEGCDRSVLAKNTFLGVDFDYLDATAVAQHLKGLPTHRVVEIEKVGVRLIEALRLHNWTWLQLATVSPLRIRTEAERLRRVFHALWQGALRP